MSFYTGTQTELLYAYYGASTNLATFTAEDNLMKTYPACIIPAGYFSKVGAQSSSLELVASGQISTVGAGVTFTISCRIISGNNPVWATAGSLLLGASNANGAVSTITLSPYRIRLHIGLRTLAAAGSATTSLVTMGNIDGPAFTAEGSIPANNVTPVLSTIDVGQPYSLFLSAACSASSATNLINLQCAKLYGEN
jgi:hypothetical protein